MISQKISSDFHEALQTWFDEHGRDLPWRRSFNPYAVLVSEFMLQQTTVAAVIPYFERWMRRFPNVTTLARASEQDVLHLWQGLGYYSRARNLHRAAQEVVMSYSGKIPRDIPTLRLLPGIGPYTAAAIAAFAFNECVPVLDANIMRVVARLVNFRGPINTAKARMLLEQAACLLLPQEGARAHTSALMDLGATTCRSGVPLCLICPVKAFCKASAPEKIPARPPRPTVIEEVDFRTFARQGRDVFLVQSSGPRWRGLWILPPARKSRQPLVVLHYSLTRHRVRLELTKGKPEKGWSPFSQNKLPPMPAPHLRALTRAIEIES